MDATGDGGKIDHWTFESNPPSWYRSVGLARADFAQAIGHTVTVEALSRQGRNALRLHAEDHASGRHVPGIDQLRGSQVAGERT